jgi:hypothetical protein
MTCLRHNCACCSRRREADEFGSAELAASLDALLALCRVVRRTSGWLEGPDKIALNAAKALLTRAGKVV